MQDMKCPQCKNTIEPHMTTCPQCHAVQGLESLCGVDPDVNSKNQKLAVFFGFLFGGLGLHKFYLGQHLKGSLYLLFCWTLVPFVIGWVDAIRTLKMSPFTFQQRYSRRGNSSYI